MSILKIAKLGHPVLQKKASLVDKLPDPNIKKLIQDMTETMLEYNGIGLAAPQVHVSKQVMILRIPDEEKKDNNSIEIMALINPKILKTFEPIENDWEGCLSIPHMLGLVKRFSRIIYECLDMNGNAIKKEATGIHARIFQHEFDHLNGILYIYRLANNKAFGFENEIKKYWKDINEKE